VTITLDLIRPRGRHRLTYRDRLAQAWTRIRYAGVPFVAVVAFWAVTVAGSGFVAGFVWARAT